MKGCEVVKKVFFITIKVLFTVSLLFFGLLALTNYKLEGFTIGSINVTAEQVQMFVDTAGDYFFWVYVAVVIFIIWRKRVKRK